MSLLDQLSVNWIKLGGVSPDALADARLQAHWALQIPAAVAHSQVRPFPDDSHTTLDWLDRLQTLIGEEIPGGFRVGLRLRDLQLRLMNKQGEDYATLQLGGRTLAAGIGWLQERLAEEAGLAGKPRVERPDYEMPGHAVGSGGRFDPDSAALGELARWYANADRALQLYAAREPSASRVRCWPHHFDTATLIELGQGRTIGVGMSPGDGSYRQPYFYVSPSPYPKSDLPVLRGGGTWHRRGWTGAVLTGSKLVSNSSAERQVHSLTEFIGGAIAACREALS